MTDEVVFFRLAAGVDVVRLPDAQFVLRSDTAAVRLEGEAAPFLVDDVFPLLDGRASIDEVSARLPGVSSSDLRDHLDALVVKGLLRRTDSPREDWEGAEHERWRPALSLLEDLGVPAPEALERLAQRAVAVVGLEAHGAQLAVHLAAIGVGTIVLADPYPCDAANLGLLPATDPVGVGRARHDVLKASLQARPTTRVETVGEGNLTRDDVASLVAKADLVVGCFDKAFSASSVWINEACFEHHVPALYGRLEGHLAFLGPLVLPHETACFMCWRMRALACEDSFEEAMAYEEQFDQARHPTLHERAVLPFLPAAAGGILAMQALVTLLGVAVPSLAGRVLEFNGLTLTSELHPVLQRPDCPACKKKQVRRQPTLDELIVTRTPQGDLEASASQIVGRRCGVVRELREVPRDPSEPAVPYVFRAEIANHRFVDRGGDELVAAGKGFTRVAATISALGEAVERYSSTCFDEDDVVFARRSELAAESIDPNELVLYRPEQYADVRYAPYAEETQLGWIPTRSLVTSRIVLAPALAVNMAYEVRSEAEFLFGPTSNGLAAGPCLAGAVLNGTLEVIERDAFVIAWCNRLPGIAVDPLTHPDAGVRGLHNAYARRGVALHLCRLPVDHPVHVFMALALQHREEGPAAVVGLGADLSPARAASKAALEICQVRPALRLRLRDPDTRSRLAELVADPHKVSSLDDHDLLYASEAMTSAFDFLALDTVQPSDWDRDALDEPIPDTVALQLARIVGHFRSLGGEVLYADLTPMDMRALGLHTARVVIPELQPIDFGWKELRIGGSRLFELPHRLGLTDAPTTVSQLNDLPHPLA